jgi:hypothetical protein
MNSSMVNKQIRKILKPFLEENGFTKITDRNYLKTIGIFDYIIEIKSVGNYFSDTTGWPPQSICITSGIFCNIIKHWHKKEYHYQMENIFTLDQIKYKKELKSEPEKKRKDILWIDNNSDLDIVVNELKKSIQNYSFDFFERFMNKKIDDVIEENEKAGGDGYFESFRLYYLYKYLKREKEAEEKKMKFIAEGKKLGLKENELLKAFEE